MKLSKKQLAHIVFESNDPASKTFDIALLATIFGSIIVAILDSVQSLHEAYGRWFYLLELGFTFLFTVEYILRVWLTSKTLKYVTSFYGIIDFVSTVPFYLQLLFPGADLRVLRMFRLMRIFKLSRYNSAFEDMVAAVKAERDSFSSAVFLLFISCLLFSSLIYIIEGHDQPEVFPSIPAAMHWFILTIIAGWGSSG